MDHDIWVHASFEDWWFTFLLFEDNSKVFVVPIRSSNGFQSGILRRFSRENLDCDASDADVSL